MDSYSSNLLAVRADSTHIKGKLAKVGLAHWSVDTNKNSIRVLFFHIVKFSNNKGQEIR